MGKQRRNKNKGGSNKSSNSSANAGSTTAKKTEVKKLSEQVFETGKNVASFNSVRLALITQIRKQYGAEIAQAVEEEKPYDWSQDDNRPKLEPVPATVTDKEERERLAKQNELDYQGEAAEFSARKRAYNDTKGKVCGLLLEHCSANLQHELKKRTEFDTVKNKKL